jgi:diguanylate cyclase (GGDEF)-like protein
MQLPFIARSSWSVSRYASLFALLVIALFIALSSLVYIKLQPIMDESALSQRKLAQDELSKAIANALITIRRDADALAAWDETRQQIGQPAYYPYWHDFRVKDAGVVSNSVSDAVIYNAKGLNLDNGKLSSLMPSKISTREMFVSFVSEGDNIFIYNFAPILQRDLNSAPIGYIGIKLDLFRYLKNSGGLQRVKLESLKLSGDAEHIASAIDVLNKLDFDFVGDSSHNAVASLLSNLLIQSALLLITCFSLLFWFLHYRLGKPLQQLSNYIDSCRMADAHPKPIDLGDVMPVTELEKVRKSLGEYQEQLVEMQGNLESSNAQLWAQAHRDPMTAAYNRRAFEEDWGHMLAVAQRKEVSTCYMLFDCDHFKPVNDTYGHHVGDEVLRSIAFTLSNALRTEEKLYRLGGDEFACLLSDVTLEEGVVIARRAEQAVATFDFSSIGIQEPIRISIGLAHYCGRDVMALDNLSRQADIAMYLAKRPGNNKITVYNDSMAEMADSVISSMETSAVYEALSNLNILEMYYQPILNLPGKEIDYYESLVRLRYKKKLIAPSSIFPVVEARRLEAEFDLAVVSRVALDLAADVIPLGSGISINISGPGILNSAVIEKLHTLASWTKKYKMVIEITETALITQIGYATVNLDGLRKLGFLIALDDFGSGYSSLRYLSDMPVDIVKFDISLIRSLMGESRQILIVENLAHLIENAGYQMVAEGIETEEMLQKVIALQFTHVQGFYLGRPQRLI